MVMHLDSKEVVERTNAFHREFLTKKSQNIREKGIERACMDGVVRIYEQK